MAVESGRYSRTRCRMATESSPYSRMRCRMAGESGRYRRTSGRMATKSCQRVSVNIVRRALRRWRMAVEVLKRMRRICRKISHSANGGLVGKVVEALVENLRCGRIFRKAGLRISRRFLSHCPLLGHNGKKLFALLVAVRCCFCRSRGDGLQVFSKEPGIAGLWN